MCLIKKIYSNKLGYLKIITYICIESIEINKMKHLFISYELALIAKQKGFNEPCIGYWESNQHPNPKEGVSWEKLSMWGNYFVLEEFEDCRLILTDNEWYYKSMIKAPLYQQIVDWLREKHKIFIWSNPILNKIDSPFKMNFIPSISMEDENYTDPFDVDDLCEDYYVALNKAIEEVFKLI